MGHVLVSASARSSWPTAATQEPIQTVEPIGCRASEPQKRAEAFLNRLASGQEFAQASVALTQQRMEDNANRKREEAEILRKGDKVCLERVYVS